MRKTKLVAIHEEGENRDNGKVFVITEMPALKAELWAARVLRHALSRMSLPAEAAAAGMAGIRAIGMQGILGAFADMPLDELKDLMEQMLACVQIAPDPRHPEIQRPLIEDDTEEISTLVRLRREWVELHTGFSLTDAPSTSAPATSVRAT